MSKDKEMISRNEKTIKSSEDRTKMEQFSVNKITKSKILDSKEKSNASVRLYYD